MIVSDRNDVWRGSSGVERGGGARAAAWTGFRSRGCVAERVRLRSGGAMILIFIEAGASAVISLHMRSANPGNMLLPPDIKMPAYKRW